MVLHWIVAGIVKLTDWMFVQYIRNRLAFYVVSGYADAQAPAFILGSCDSYLGLWFVTAQASSRSITSKLSPLHSFWSAIFISLFSQSLYICQDPPELIEPNKIMVFEGLHPIYDEKASRTLQWEGQCSDKGPDMRCDKYNCTCPSSCFNCFQFILQKFPGYFGFSISQPAQCQDISVELIPGLSGKRGKD